MGNERVRIKLGSVEVEYEGCGEFARSGVLDLLRDALALAPNSGKGLGADVDGAFIEPQAFGDGEHSSVTVATIAAHFEPQGAQDLVLCALAKLQVLEGASQASKEDIWECMKGATGYFKASMSKNFPRDLGRMVKGKKINEVATNEYSLTAATRKELEARVADIG